MSHEHYYTPNPTSEVVEKQMLFPIGDHSLSFVSVSGVFGFSHYVDKASQMLIHAFHPTGNECLDLGCGFGAVGLSAKLRFPAVNVTLSDINTRAVDYARKNAVLNNLAVNIITSDLFAAFPEMKFTDILSNPPIAMGKPFLVRLIQESYEHLADGGAFWLVAFHNKGGSTLKKIMAECFGNAEDVEKGGGIRVYKSIKTSR